ncbi:MAG TPA: gamma-glutamyltransferase [Bryobacteraceae bacterium]|nr:gamma-glutamyltransferase [Bryobacteraceae bacterium]
MRTIRLLILTAAFLTCLPSVNGQLFERVAVGRPATRRTIKPIAMGTHHAVTSMMPQATMAAQRILQSGGNAFDAIVGGQAVLGLVAPASNGVGSDAVLLVYDAKQKKAWSINAEGTAPKLATIEWYRKNHDGKLPVNETLLSATIPGLIDAWYILMSRWGTKTFAEVLTPAIELAEGGFALTAAQASEMNTAALAKYASSRKVYQPDGKRWIEGDIFKNPELARTFRRLVEAERQAARSGRGTALKAARDRFYKGDIAREMAKFAEANGGLMRYEDFASYEAKVEETVSYNYRGYVVHKNPSASQGPAELFALSILQGFDLKKMGHNSADYIHTLAEATKLAMADREKYLGDMDFIRIPYKGLLSEQYAVERRKLIDPARASMELRAGRPDQFEPAYTPVSRPDDYNTTGNGDHDGDTSYIGVVDAQRNAVSFTPSLHSGHGTKVVMGDLGFPLNCRGDYYSLVDGHANALEPGKRPRSTLQGTLVTREGELFLITGCPGGDNQNINTMQTLLNIVDFGMNVQQAIEAPRWTTRSFPASPAPHTMYPGDLQVEDRVPQAVRLELVQRGHRLTVLAPLAIGANGAIVSDAGKGIVAAGADPRNSALALAW